MLFAVGQIYKCEIGGDDTLFTLRYSVHIEGRRIATKKMDRETRNGADDSFQLCCHNIPYTNNSKEGVTEMIFQLPETKKDGIES